MVGINRHTGAILSGFDHVAQSIGVIVTTAKASRVMRRAFGGGLPRLVDSPISPTTVIDFYAAVAKGVADYEPRFRVSRMSIDNAAAGHLSLNAQGVYFPRGHLGDFSISEPKTIEVPL